MKQITRMNSANKSQKVKRVRKARQPKNNQTTKIEQEGEICIEISCINEDEEDKTSDCASVVEVDAPTSVKREIIPRRTARDYLCQRSDGTGFYMYGFVRELSKSEYQAALTRMMNEELGLKAAPGSADEGDLS